MSKTEQRPSQWSRLTSEIKKVFQPRCSLVCNESGQTVKPTRPQLKSIVVRPREDRPNQWQETHRCSSVFSRLQLCQANDRRHNGEFEASSSVERRPRIVKPRNTSPDKWFRVEHPKFPAVRPPLSKSQKRHYQRYRQAARRVREETSLENMPKENPLEDLEALKQGDMEMDFHEAVEFMSSRKGKEKMHVQRSPSCSEGDEVFRPRRECKPKERVGGRGSN